jgi:hypothetical protein
MLQACLTSGSVAAHAHPSATFCNRVDRRTTVRLTFLGKNSQPNQSPTLYATDRGSYVVQGWIVSDPNILMGLDIRDDEAVVEVPPKLMIHLAKDGLSGDVVNLVHPIVHVTNEGRYIVKGKRVSDTEALGQMDIPDHETCVEVAKSAVAALLIGG